MSTALATVTQPIDSTLIERVLLHGDLRQLSPAQKVSYYNAVCQSVGLNPLTQPFAYLVLNGKEILYAKREATEQLRQIHAVSIQIMAREVMEDCYVVTARATLPSGRQDENIGAVAIAGLKGDARANAMMKAETKAKRRVTLAICGLGMLDETEVETIPGAYTVAPAPVVSGTTREREHPAAATGETRGTLMPPDKDGHADLVDEVTGDVIEPYVAEMPEGAVRITRIDRSPTKNPKVTRYVVHFSDGTSASTIKDQLFSVCEQARAEETPIYPQFEMNGTYTNLIGVSTRDTVPF